MMPGCFHLACCLTDIVHPGGSTASSPPADNQGFLLPSTPSPSTNPGKSSSEELRLLAKLERLPLASDSFPAVGGFGTRGSLPPGASFPPMLACLSSAFAGVDLLGIWCISEVQHCENARVRLGQFSVVSSRFSLPMLVLDSQLRSAYYSVSYWHAVGNVRQLKYAGSTKLYGYASSLVPWSTA